MSKTSDLAPTNGGTGLDIVPFECLYQMTRSFFLLKSPDGLAICRHQLARQPHLNATPQNGAHRGRPGAVDTEEGRARGEGGGAGRRLEAAQRFLEEGEEGVAELKLNTF